MENKQIEKEKKDLNRCLSRDVSCMSFAIVVHLYIGHVIRLVRRFFLLGGYNEKYARS